MTEEGHVVEHNAPTGRSILRRPGCLVGLILWFIIMLLPFVMLILAVEGHITVSYGDRMPDRFEHPRLQVKLVSEIDYRGLSITNSDIKFEDDTHMAVQTNVRFMLWQGEGIPVVFCDYYQIDNNDQWQFASRVLEACE